MVVFAMRQSVRIVAAIFGASRLEASILEALQYE
jgi:hypothetical protein